MKNLTHYFKNGESNSAAETSKSENNNEAILEGSREQSSSQNQKQKSKTKKRRKASDPAVVNISEMLSVSLNIISPNEPVKDERKTRKTSERHKKKGGSTEKASSEKNNLAKDFQITPDKDETSKSKTQCNLKLRRKQSDLSSFMTTSTPELAEIIGIADEGKQHGEYDESEDAVIQTSDNNAVKDAITKTNAFEFMMESRKKSIGQNSPGREKIDEDEEVEENKSISKQKRTARKSLLQKWSDEKGGLKRKRIEEEKEEIINIKLENRAHRFKQMLTLSKRKRVAVIDSDTESGEGDGKQTKASIDLVEIEDASEVVKPPTALHGHEQENDFLLGKPAGSSGKTTEVENTVVTDVTKIKMSSFTENPQSSKIKIKEESPSKGRKNKRKKRRSILSLTKIEKTHVEDAENKDLLNAQPDNDRTQFLSAAKSTINVGVIDVSQDSIENGEGTNKRTRQKRLDENSPSSKHWKIKIKAPTDENINDNGSLRRSTRTRNQTRIMHEDFLCDAEVSLEITSSSDEEWKNKEEDKKGVKKEEKKHVKLAPIFLRNSPKPTLDPALIEAKRNFLHSGIPESLKKIIERQKTVENVELEVFPDISHVQQKNEQSTYWNLPAVSLTLRKEASPIKTGTNLSVSLFIQKEDSKIPPQISSELQSEQSVTENLNLRRILKQIKEEQPEFPVYRTFRLLREKGCKTRHKAEIKENKPKRGRKKKEFVSEQPKATSEQLDPVEHAMWTEKYKAQSSQEILGNNSAVAELKAWLKSWAELTKEISAQRAKRKRTNSSSSDFDSADSNSRDSTGLPSNTVIVSGPVASGKTMAVYAIANELDLNVLELNASSKRTGKRLLQELQEATQSHQVRKKGSKSLLNMYKMQEQNKDFNEDCEGQNHRKMCLLLVEDIDIVFEQDEGFLSALGQLLNTSKRPVVLVTSDLSVPHLSKFISQYRVINFNLVSERILTSWLQLVCLLEGLHVTRAALQELLVFNRRDVRKTLLQLQFWVGSGGERNRNNCCVSTEGKDEETVWENLEVVCKDEDDDSLKVSWLEEERTDETESLKHDNCIGSFLAFNFGDKLPCSLNEQILLWWNCNKLLKSCGNEKKSIQSAATLLESQSVACLFSEEEKPEFCLSSWDCVVKDSLELRENFKSYTQGSDLAEQIRHSVLESSLNIYKKAVGAEDISLNVGLLDREQHRWRKARHSCDESFTEVVPYFMRTDRKAVAVNYLPSLRDISRSESARLAVNKKRGNRFYNYLDGLGLDCSEAVLKTAHDVFQ